MSLIVNIRQCHTETTPWSRYNYKRLATYISTVVLISNNVMFGEGGERGGALSKLIHVIKQPYHTSTIIFRGEGRTEH